MRLSIARSLPPVLVLLAFLIVPQRSLLTDQLAPTSHPALPQSVDAYWYVPTKEQLAPRAVARYEPLTKAVEEYAAGNDDRVLALLSGAPLKGTPLADYARYYLALAQLRASRTEEAREAFGAIRRSTTAGYLPVAAALGEAEAAYEAGDYRAAADIYAKLASDEPTTNPSVLLKLGRAWLAAEDQEKAAEAFLRVYYQFPLASEAVEAETELKALTGYTKREDLKLELGRAARLFGARRYADAREAYSALLDKLTGDEREVAGLRIAECDYFLGKFAQARLALQPYLKDASRRAEARFFHAGTLRELGRHEEYVAEVHSLVADFPDSSWSEEALNNLGTHYILENEDGRAAEVFAELLERFPTGQRAERAAWKAGWWAYKNGDYATAIRIFEGAAATFPRSDYRPSFLYWAARAHGKLGASTQAISRLQLVYADYGSSYYGRLAYDRLPAQARTLDASFVPASLESPDVDAPPTIEPIRHLLAAGLFDDALNELRHAEREWGMTPALQATMAYAHYRKGDLRRAIVLMRRAYPQHLTARGEELPAEILQVIYPLTYWDLIRKHSAARHLDPYLVAALIAQESTFDPKIRSAANAWGLMQILPSTGRSLARSLGIRRFRTSMLTNPEMNIRLGTLYFSRLVKQFGGTHYALASYNAGQNRVVRWKAERPGLDQDEFIDDIPFPETQNYVKRILGTAEDYRMLYGKGGPGRPIAVADE